jgi:uncharacterized protein (TIGR02679 family)
MSWVDDPALRRIWDVLRRRFEERGLCAEGQVILTALTREERHAAAALVGRPVTTARCRVDLAVLDAELVARSGVGGLRAVLERVTGSPPRDRPSERARHAADRDVPFTLASALLADTPWLHEWLDGVRRAGLLRRTTDPEAAIRHAVAVLARLPAATSRTELAAVTAGSAHALDDGRTVTALVLRALAAQRGEPPPATAAARRELWESAGVGVDAVSTTCLTLGLRATGQGSAPARLASAAEAGDPVHLTPWDLRRCVLTAPRTVLICENPRVLEAVAERHGSRHPVICTSGQPALVVLDVLRALADARLLYHGDFDWPGIAIANRLITEAGVTPWRMAGSDYFAALPQAALPLAGAPIDPTWDPELGAAMRYHGLAIHEEAVLGHLIDGLE